MVYSKSMKRNDTGPPLTASLKSKSSGSAIDLTNVSIMFVMNSTAGVELVNSAATVTDVDAGEFQYDWSVGDTSEIGTHLAAFQLVYTAESNRKETYPASGWINIEIQPDLENE